MEYETQASMCNALESMLGDLDPPCAPSVWRRLHVCLGVDEHIGKLYPTVPGMERIGHIAIQRSVVHIPSNLDVVSKQAEVIYSVAVVIDADFNIGYIRRFRYACLTYLQGSVRIVVRAAVAVYACA